jgi:hypothetical protein
MRVMEAACCSCCSQPICCRSRSVAACACCSLAEAADRWGCPAPAPCSQTQCTHQTALTPLQHCEAVWHVSRITQPAWGQQAVHAHQA